MPSKKPSSAIELYEEYKNAITQHADYISELKEKVSAIIAKKQLVSFMNDTKWLELQNAIQELSFPPPYILRCVTDEDDLKDTFLDKAPRWIGDWSNYYMEGMPILFNIEWIKVRPQISRYRGRLIADDIVDETETFIALLDRLHIPYEEKDNVFTIYGYKKP